jgi:uncharacterized membrane protein YjgN (DUF898 family)
VLSDLATFYNAGVRNITYNELTLDGRHQFRSSINRLGYCWVILSNLVVSTLSLFLMRPWAAVRSWRYLSERTGMIVIGNLDEFVGQGGGAGNVAAAEYANIEWMSIGI